MHFIRRVSAAFCELISFALIGRPPWRRPPDLILPNRASYIFVCVLS